MQLLWSYLAGECNVHNVKIEFLLVSGNVFQSFDDKSILINVRDRKYFKGKCRFFFHDGSDQY